MDRYENYNLDQTKFIPIETAARPKIPRHFGVTSDLKLIERGFEAHLCQGLSYMDISVSLNPKTAVECKKGRATVKLSANAAKLAELSLTPDFLP